MKKIKIIFTGIILLAISFTSCKKDDPEPVLTPKSITLTEHAPEVIDSNNDFGIELFKKVALEKDENLMLSPLSAGAALTMLLNGCDGNTFEQLKSTLKYPDNLTIDDINEAYNSLVGQLLDADNKVTLALANAIFYRDGFSVKEPFLNTMQASFSADIESLNFSSPTALDIINGWASDNTNGKIDKVLDEISGNAVMFIMNALYFKGDWSNQFDESLTEDRMFYPDGSDGIMVSTMTGEVRAKTYSGDNYKAVELPYGRTNFTMIIMVPDETLADLTGSFTSSEWTTMTDAFSALDYYDTEVFMPLYKFSYEKFLNDQLKSMGMIDALSPSMADLSGIAEGSIFVSFVKQNTFVEVNEKGTEAAAVTTIGVELTSVPSGPPVFTVDKSFVFAIRERTTNTILFIGQVLTPEYDS
ncbi:MAG: serpin family protein [Bacteroidales bacterium]|nr:serpin family protein [Bacteroidales bacterium]